MDPMRIHDNVANDERVTFGSALPTHEYGPSSLRAETHFLSDVDPTDTSHILGVMNVPPRKSRQLLEQEWENLKDYLYMYYIQENKTLENIRKILREKHGVLLTQKQLTRRFTKWKFKKNVKQSETETYLQKTAATSWQTNGSVDGVRITAAKRDRWGKRVKQKALQEGPQSPFAGQGLGIRSLEDTAESDCTCLDKSWPTSDTPLNFGHVASSRSLLTYSLTTTSPVDRHENPDRDLTRHPSPSPRTISATASSATLSQRTVSPLVLSSALSPITQPVLSEGLTIVGEKEAQQSLSDDPWPFVPTSGDSGPLLLDRLFSALNLEPLYMFTSFWGSEVAADTTDQTSDCISNDKLFDLTHTSEKTFWHNNQRTTPRSLSITHVSPHAFRFANVDAIFPSQEIVLANPLNVELYPFPRHEGDQFEARSTSKYHDTLRMEMKECTERIQKLEFSCLGHTTAATTLIDRLAVAYFGLGNYDEAERQFKRILPSLVQKHGSNSRYVVSVQRDLAEVVLHLGRFTEANQMAQRIYTTALSIDIPCGPLVQRSLHILAQSYGNLRDLAKEEELLKQLVQMRLSSLGPRHGDALAAIRSLCDSMIDSERHSESEELLRVALELSQSAQGLSDRRRCLIYRKLATVLFKQRKYYESESLYRRTAEMSERLLGSEHPDTLRCRFWLSKVLRARGSLEESLSILSSTVESQIKTRGELRGSTIESMASMSTVLVQMEKTEDAERWMKRALRCSQRIKGVEKMRIIQFYRGLSALHEGQLPHQLFVDLYEEMGQELCTLVGPGSRSIEEMSKWSDKDRR